MDSTIATQDHQISRSEVSTRDRIIPRSEISTRDHQAHRSGSPVLAGSGDDSDDNAPVFQSIIPHIGIHRRSASFGRRLSGTGSQLNRQLSRQLSRQSSKETNRDPDLDVDALPYRTLSVNANFDEYTHEHASGEIKGPVVVDPSGREKQYRLVTFTPNDPENPKNWSKGYKWYCTMVVAVTCFVVAFASSVITADLRGVQETFDVSAEVALLTITVFVVGFGVGPLLFAPLSEIYGRRIIYGTTLLVAVVFVIPCAVAKNIETLIVCRALGGIAFSAPMTLVGGTLADLWRNEERGVPMAAFSAAPFIGPAIGPLVGGYLSDAAGWRWLYWIQLILASVVWVLITFTVPETYAPTILARRARKLQKDTGSTEHVTEQDLDLRPFSERLSIFLVRPLQLLFRELIVFLISLYMSVLYGLLYMFFVAYPIIYQDGKGWSAGSTGLMFIPLAIGVIASAFFSPLVNKHYLHISARWNGRPPAEYRLIPMMCSCWFIPVGLLVFSWTSYPRVHWIGPAIGGFPVGFGFIFLYNSANNYLVDSYQHQAASALAAKTFIRSFWGAAVVLFTDQMYTRCGYQWASMILFFISLACCGIPFLFWKFGAQIRAKSRYAYAGHDDGKEMAPGSGTSSDEEKQVGTENQGVNSDGGGVLTGDRGKRSLGANPPAPPLNMGPAP